MIRNFDSYIAEAMSYKPIDRSQVHSRDLILSDGNAYNVYVDPFTIATRRIWEDMQAYELFGDRPANVDALKARMTAM